MKKIVLIILACLLAGGGLAYLASYLIYTPILEDYVAQINDQNNEISQLVQINCNLEQTVANQKALMSTQQTEIESLEAETAIQKQIIADKENRITSLRLEKTLVQEQLSDAEAEIEDLEGDLLSKKKEIFDITQQLDGVLNITVTQHYQWVYGGRTWDWDLPISIGKYMEFSERPRPLSISQYVDMVKEDDIYVDQMVKELNKAASGKRYNDVQKLNFVVSFVQNLPYTVDEETTPYDEYPRYPLETLFDRGGDCEDTSILIAALLDRMGYDVILLHLKNEQHMAVGVAIPVSYGIYYEFNGKKYYYLETTGEGWKVGDFPQDFSDTTAYIYPLSG